MTAPPASSTERVCRESSTRPGASGHPDRFLRPGPDSSPRDQRPEGLAALLVVAELVEAGARGREQHHLPGPCRRGGSRTAVARSPQRRSGTAPSRSASSRSAASPIRYAATACAPSTSRRPSKPPPLSSRRGSRGRRPRTRRSRARPTRRWWPSSRSRRARRRPWPPPRAGAARRRSCGQRPPQPPRHARGDRRRRGAHRVLEVVRAAEADLLGEEAAAPRTRRAARTPGPRPPAATATCSGVWFRNRRSFASR